MDKEYYNQNRQRLISELKKKLPELKNSYILFRGSINYPNYDSDTYYTPVKYEEVIQYFFGIRWVDIDACIEIDTGKSFFITPNLISDDFFYFKQLSKDQAIQDYGVDDLYLEKEFKVFLKNQKPSKLFRYKGLDTYSQKQSNFYNSEILIDFYDIIDDDILYPLINNLRCKKQNKELEYIKKACEITCKSHIDTMQFCIPGFYEYQISANFQKYCNKMGSEDHAYNPICGANRNGAYLHYMKNTDILQNGFLMLADMGCKVNGICTDVTCTYPINGKFTTKQAQIYSIVLQAQQNAISKLKPDVQYSELQNQAYLIILNGLKDVGCLKGDVQEMFKAEVHKIFMPHSLGHFIGYKTHDVGPQVDQSGDKEKDKQFKLLPQCQLQKGFTITVEPGIYFIDKLIEKTKDLPIKVFFNYQLITQFRNEVGGVRIEDVLAITENGYQNFCVVPRTIEEIENCMKGINWKKNQFIQVKYF